MDFSGLSLIKLKKQEMETQVGALMPPAARDCPAPWASWAVLSWLHGPQVRVLELEKTLEAERVRLGELRKQHYVLAGAMGTPGEEEHSRPSPAPRSGATKKPPLAQKPNIAPRQDSQVPGIRAGLGRRALGMGEGRGVATPGWDLHFWPHLLSPTLIFDPCSSTKRMVSTQLSL